MRKLGIYILITTLLFSLNPMPSMVLSAEETDEEEVVLFSKQVDGEIPLYEEIEDIEQDNSMLLIPDNSESISLETESVIEVSGEKYSYIRYVMTDDNGEELLFEGYVDSETVVSIDIAEQFSKDRQQQEEENESDSDDQQDESDELDSDVQQEEADESDSNTPLEGEVGSNDSLGETAEENTESDDELVNEEEDRDEIGISTFSSQPKSVVQESKTSKLGHIRSGRVSIYESIGGKSFTAGDKYTNAVYYIKKQAKVGNETYYLISTQASATKGIVGWVKSKDMSINTHVGVDKKAKTFYIKGNGKATTTAWGGSKDAVYTNMSKYENKAFKVHLTEKVGNNTWYRGTLDGKTVWLHSSYVYSASKSKISKLGHIRSGNVQIYESISGKSFTAGEKLTNAVYYIKEQAKHGNDMYYLISTQPSATKGIVGWVKSKDLSTHEHVGVDKKAKTFYVKGNGKATAKAWGGSKDTVYANLAKYKNKPFQVHLTEKVGKNTWYRGKLDGKTVWLHSSYVVSAKEDSTSKLGHIRSSNVNIYKQINGTSFKAGSQYTNAVYYIKKQAKLGSETYYLISTQPSATKGVIGWVKSKDLSTHPHVGVDKKAKSYYIKGSGKSFAKAWGGSKDSVYSLSSHAGELFQIHLTEKVGNNTWHRGKLNGKTVWIHSSYLTKTYAGTTNYNLTLDAAVNIQYNRFGQDGKRHHQIQKNGKWMTASKADIRKYMDPKKFKNDPKQKFQFLDLSKPSGASVALLNKHLSKKGALKNQGQAFYDAAKDHGINDLYLVAHAQLETGHGTSKLASGVEVGINKKGGLELVTKDNRKNLKNIKKTYNMFGIGAVDGDALAGGAKTAYANEWFSAKTAVNGGAKWISNQYIQNSYKQNTLYKMSWNPKMANGAAWKQYASDVAWASKQVNTIYNMYNEIGFTGSMSFDYPNYK